jgi:hypothetical protein
MMKYKYSLFLILILNHGFAQFITPDVVASSGAHFNTGNTQLSWTLGEPLTDTYTTGGNILTQCFQQTELLIMGLEEYYEFQINV